MNFTHALSANIRSNKQWTMKGVTQKILQNKVLRLRRQPPGNMESFLSLDQVDVLESPPSSLSTPDLMDYIKALQESGQDADKYLLALWRKFSVPLITGAMVLFSLSFVFGVKRRVSAGRAYNDGLAYRICNLFCRSGGHAHGFAVKYESARYSHDSSNLHLYYCILAFANPSLGPCQST